MQLIDGRPVYAATDLVGFLWCEYLTEQERAVLAGLTRRPERDDPELDRIRQRGQEHEQRYLADLVAAGRTVTTLKIPDEGWKLDKGAALREAAGMTRVAIERGDDVIYQACFFDGTWLGFADFLLRVDGYGPLGWSYEVADTKLARHTKGSALLQICSYIDQLTPIQGVEPRDMHVALGGSKRETQTFRVADYMAYYRMVRGLFEEAAGSPLPTVYPPAAGYPEPVEHCDVCRWAVECQARRRSDDDLSLVAGIPARTRKELKERGIATRRGLAAQPMPLDPRLERTGDMALAKLHEQALIQVRGDDEGRPLYKLLPAIRTDAGRLDTAKGLLALPEPSPNDLFLDLEGDPFALDDGVDYLFGILEPATRDEHGNARYHAFWARDDAGRVTHEAEKRAFEQAVDLIMDRFQRDPTLHVYHYASYEPAALGRLMGRYGTREAEIDRLLRGDVLVDLFRVVRQGLIASVESYSIKKLEPQYGYERTIDLRSANSSIVEFETWLELGGEAGGQDAVLDEIAAYNRDDVESTLKLRDWLEERRTELGRQLAEPLERPTLETTDPTENVSEWLARVNAVAGPLLAPVPTDEATRLADPAAQARWLLAQLLGWHRREAKAAWWRYFALMEDMTDDERVDASEPIGNLELVGPEDENARSWRYSFPTQLHRIDAGRDVKDPDPDLGGFVRVLEVDDEHEQVVLRHPKTRTLHHPRSLVPELVYRTDAQEQSLLTFGAWVVEHGIDADGPYRAASDLLLGRPPRVGLRDGSELRMRWETPDHAARQLAVTLDRSYLAVQGPPGSGKTWTGARVILDLVKAGKRVGVTGNSHAVIGNLLDAVWAAAAEDGYPIQLGQKPSDGEQPTCSHATSFKSNQAILGALIERTIQVAGGTSWLWARAEFQGAVDVLVIDEAGQFSLANAVAVSPAAASVVLLGDPQQLDQPITGSHPPGAAGSALGHLLNGRPTMPSTHGLFLERTWRLHPTITSYTSELFYANELLPEDGNERQELDGSDLLDGAGLRLLIVPHSGNTTDSPEEAAAIAEAVDRFLARGPTWIDRDGDRHRVGLRDVLILTPYNAHKGAVERALRGARVDTVDAFQGQESPVAIYTLGTSSPDEAPRGMSFLFNTHRLNVATSRARCVTLVVASPALLRVRALTPEQMRLANALARYAEVATVKADAAGAFAGV